MSRWKSTSFFVVALALAFFLIRWNDQGDLSSRMGMQRILSANELDLKRLVFLDQTNQITFSLNESGNWLVGNEQEKLVRASQIMIESLLNELRVVKLREGFALRKMQERGFTLADYGLDIPQRSLTVDRGGGETVWLWGAQSSVDKAQYIMIRGGDYMYTFDPEKHSFFPSQASDFYEYNIFTESMEQLDRIELSGVAADGFIQLLRNGSGGWQLTQPRLGSVEERDFLALMEMLRRCQLQSFVDGSADQITSFGFDEPYFQLSISSVESGRQMFRVGDVAAGDDSLRYATQSGTDRVGLLETELINELIESIENLRASQVFDMRGSSLSHCYIYDDVREIKLATDSNLTWRVDNSFNWLIENSVINELREFVEGMVITRFDVEPNLSSTRVNMEVSFGGQDYKEAITCLVPNDFDAPVQIQFMNENKVHEVNRVKPLFDWLNPLAYMQRALFEKNWQVSRIDRIVGTETNSITRVQSYEDKQNSVSGTIAAPDWALVTEDIINLQAESYVVSYPPALDVFQLDQPMCKLLFYESSQAWHTKELLIGGFAPVGGRYAMIKGHELIFILSDSSVQKCMKPWRDGNSDVGGE